MDIEQNNEYKTKTTVIYRFNFSTEFLNNLLNFSKIHQYVDRIEFKEKWEKWLIDNNNNIIKEIDYLHSIGYNGNVKEKMFKSARYYLKNKSLETPIPQTRRKYVTINKYILELMDEYIKSNKNIKPAESFDNFCGVNMEILSRERDNLRNNYNMNIDDIKSKFKKTYKNRYFNIVK
jgi:hypothetical protein